MLASAESLWGFSARALNGDAGQVHDLQVDDRRWSVREIVLNTGPSLTGRQALLRPDAIVDTDHVGRVLHVSLTMEQIARLPGIDTHPPVAQQEGVKPYSYLGLSSFGGGVPLQGASEMRMDFLAVEQLRVFDPHLRSIRELHDYRLEARHGNPGRVVDWLLDDRGWVTVYAIVETGPLAGRRDVLIPVRWLGPINWAARVIHVDLEASAIIQAPAYDAATLRAVDYEARVRAWYGRSALPKNSRLHP